METKTAKKLNIRLSGNIPDTFVVITNKDEIDLENDKKIFLLATKKAINNCEDYVSVYQTEFDIDRQMVKPFIIDDQFVSLAHKYKDDLIMIIV